MLYKYFNNSFTIVKEKTFKFTIEIEIIIIFKRFINCVNRTVF